MTRKHMKKHIQLLKILKRLNKSDLTTVVKYLDNKGIDCLCECIYNALNTNLSLKKSVKKKLQRELKGKEKVLKILSDKNRSIKIRHRLLQQHGGFLSVIIGALVPVLIDLVVNRLKK